MKFPLLSFRIRSTFLLAVSLWALPAIFAAAAPAAPAEFSPYLPPVDKSTGAAVLIVFGAPLEERIADSGAQLASFLNAREIAVQFARWLNVRGIAGFVLPQTNPAADPAAAAAEVSRAVRLLRMHAADYKISPRRVALLGFGRGAEWAAEAAYQSLGASATATDSAEKFSSRPDLLALVWGSRDVAKIPSNFPPTFFVGSTRTSDGMSGMIDLWTKMRAAHVSVDAHFFAQGSATSGLGGGDESLSSWPESFFNWARFCGLLTDEPRLPVKGMVYLDGRELASGYVLLTPVDFSGAGPIIGRVLNSSGGVPIGQFSIPADQGPIAGRYKVDVRQNMNRWLSNSFTGGLTGGRGGVVTPEQAYFGHHRLLSPSIDDQHSYTKVRPGDSQDYMVEIKPGADANLDLKFEVFSK